MSYDQAEGPSQVDPSSDEFPRRPVKRRRRSCTDRDETQYGQEKRIRYTSTGDVACAAQRHSTQYENSNINGSAQVHSGDHIGDRIQNNYQIPLTNTSPNNPDKYGYVINAGGNARIVAGDVYQQPEALTKEQKCHLIFKTSSYETHKDRNPRRADETCIWLLDHPQYCEWLSDHENALLWVSADPGCGKSVLSKALVDDILPNDNPNTVCYFFFKDNEEQDNLTTALCALLHQLFSQRPHLLHYAIPAWEKNGEQLRNETQEMWRIFLAAATDREAGPVTCVLDALDECRDVDRRQLIQLLCGTQQSTFQSRSPSMLKVLATSRPYDNVQRWFSEATSRWPHIRLRGEDENDQIHQEINLVIKQRVQELSNEQQGRWEEAEQLKVQVVETSKTKLGADHPSTLNSIANLASTYWDQGRWEEAEQLDVQVVETSKTKLGADHPNTLNSMANLASTYRQQGRWEEAERLDVQVMETRKTKLGADHPNTLASMANLASTYWEQGRWEEAERLDVQVMETRKTKLGADHPSTLNSMANLASTYRQQGRWEEAERLDVQVMETRKTKLGADHPNTLNSMANLASTYRQQGRWEEAERLDVQVMETRKTKLGADHPNTLASMANLASTYWDQGRWEEAEQLEVQVVEMRKTKLGADHPSTLTSMANLASTYWDQGRWEEAEQLLVQVVETSKTKLGADHPHTLISMHNLAYTWKDLGRDEEALQLIRDCVERRSGALGVEHPDYIRSYQTLIHWDTDTTDSDTDISIEEAVS